jgi:hypothetical protein
MLKRFILWDYPRASWQYDVVVGIIVAFMFLTPRDWFRDQPRVPSVTSIGHNNFWVDQEFLARVPESQWLAKVGKEVQSRPATHHDVVVRVEPILNAEGELQGYMALSKP